MNVHCCQTLGGRAELEELMAVEKNNINPGTHRPIFSVIQDTLTGAFLITGQNIFLNKSQTCQILFNCHHEIVTLPEPAIRFGDTELWTGKQLVSTILPKNFSYYPYGHKSDEKDDTKRVSIRNGDLMDGQLSKKTIGKSERGLLHRFYHQYGANTMQTFINKLQQLVNEFMLIHSFSTGMNDCCVSVEVRNKSRTLMQECLQKANSLTREEDVNRCLNKGRDKIGNLILNSLPYNHGMRIMSKAGSKGSSLNLSQIMGVVGQQNVEGGRIPQTVKGRSLPHFVKDDPNPEARGFVTKSYLEGLKPHHFFFHMAAGREGIIDTAVSFYFIRQIVLNIIMLLYQTLTLSFYFTVQNCRRWVPSKTANTLFGEHNDKV